MVFVRKKKIKGRDYFYVVQSTRAEKGWKKIERYIGISRPDEKDLKKYAEEFDAVKEFISSKKEVLETIKKNCQKKRTKDELRNIEDGAMVKFTYDTSRMEGSSLTYKDTKMLLQEGISPKEKPLRDIKEAENHRKAYFYMKSRIKEDITTEFILKLHEILKKDVTEDAGKFRDGNVFVGDLVPVKPSMVLGELDNLISWDKTNKKLHPLELAAIFHCGFEKIHPFFDGNGRVGRLLLNLILLKGGYPLVIIQHKNKRRYYNALRRADSGNYLYMVKYLFSEMEHSKLYLPK